MDILKRKIKGSTLIEVVVAMVIILTCMGIAMSVFSNMSRDINDELRILAEIHINTVAEKTKKNREFIDLTKDFENIRIEQSILSYPKKARLRILFIEAFTPQGNKIAEYREIISIDDKTIELNK